jgi:hypothetical protein
MGRTRRARVFLFKEPLMIVQRLLIGRVVALLSLCVAVALFTASGCENKAKDSKAAKDSKEVKAAKDTAAGDDLLVLEYEEIDIIPGGEKQVKIKSGKVEKAEAPADSGVTAKVEDGKLTVSAAKDAKEGTHNVAIKGSKKDATLKVHVKKAG